MIYLASFSVSRKRLLELAHIPCVCIGHAADETAIPLEADFAAYVTEIAQTKSMHACLDAIDQHAVGAMIRVLAADTLAQTVRSQQILGKPRDHAHAHAMLDTLMHEHALVVTACVLAEYHLRDGQWQRHTTTTWTEQAEVRFVVPTEAREQYFSRMPGVMGACGAAIIEDYGSCFLEYINGSYSAVMGLPLHALCARIGYY